MSISVSGVAVASQLSCSFHLTPFELPVHATMVGTPPVPTIAEFFEMLILPSTALLRGLGVSGCSNTSGRTRLPSPKCPASLRKWEISSMTLRMRYSVIHCWISWASLLDSGNLLKRHALELKPLLVVWPGGRVKMSTGLRPLN